MPALLLLSLVALCPAARAAREPIAVRVLPFERLRNPAFERPADATYAFLGDGLADTLTVALAHVKGLRILERPGRSLPSDRARQGARLVVVGSFGRVGAEIRVTCRVVYVRDGKVDPKHAVSLKRKVDGDQDAFALEEEVATALLRTFGVTPAERERQAIRQAARRAAPVPAGNTPPLP